MILILNAASKLASVIVEMLPPYAKKHYWTFRYIYSGLINPVEVSAQLQWCKAYYMMNFEILVARARTSIHSISATDVGQHTQFGGN